MAEKKPAPLGDLFGAIDVEPQKGPSTLGLDETLPSDPPGPRDPPVTPAAVDASKDEPEDLTPNESAKRLVPAANSDARGESVSVQEESEVFRSTTSDSRWPLVIAWMAALLLSAVIVGTAAPWRSPKPETSPETTATPEGPRWLRVGGPELHHGAVWINGELHGHAPLELSLPQGTHHVEVRRADAELIDVTIHLSDEHRRERAFRLVR